MGFVGLGPVEQFWPKMAKNANFGGGVPYPSICPPPDYYGTAILAIAYLSICPPPDLRGTAVLAISEVFVIRPSVRHLTCAEQRY